MRLRQNLSPAAAVAAAAEAGPGAGGADRDLDMEGPGADGEPACLSGILNYLNKSSILICTYPYLSRTILYDPVQSASSPTRGFVTQIHVDKSR